MDGNKDRKRFFPQFVKRPYLRLHMVGGLNGAASMSWFYFALGSLATWRFTHLLVAEDGPWDILLRIRRNLAGNTAGKLLDCFYCCSLWVSIALCFPLAQTLKDRLILWPSLSAAAILIENLSERLGEPAAAAYVVEGDQRNELLRENQQYGASAE